MEIDAHLAALESEGLLLAEAARAAALTDSVPGCPDWTVRDLLAHIGEVHRWAATVVTHRVPKHDELPEGAIEAAPEDAALLDWYVDGHATLLATLQRAPDDLACFTFLPAPSPRAFWSRRQAHETAIHRADACGAAGVPIDFDDALAVDGIEEMLYGFALRPRTFEPGTIRLSPAGHPDLLVTLSADGVKTTAAGDEPADATVTGTASNIYRWLWNRPSAAQVDGAADVAQRWQGVKVRWT